MQVTQLQTLQCLAGDCCIWLWKNKCIFMFHFVKHSCVWCINIRKLLLNISSLLLLTLIIMGQQSLNSLLQCLFCGNSYLSSCFLKNFIGQCNILNFCLILFFCWSWSTYSGLLPENLQVGCWYWHIMTRNTNQRWSFNVYNMLFKKIF